MASVTSPDYSITKPGLLRRREKLIRTYGRRAVNPSSQLAEPKAAKEPPAKKPRTNEIPTASPEPPEDPVRPPGKGSILRYFKPAPSLVPPPSSTEDLPIKDLPKRRPRLLKIRPFDAPEDALGLRSDAQDSAPVKTRSLPVQTTLNISSQAAFSECTVCDTVWNPLYPDDVRYHKKRHGAVLRKRVDASL